MTTTEFIKLIKDYNDGKKAQLRAGWKSLDPIYIISESELEKIEKVSIELLDTLKELRDLMQDVIDSEYKPDNFTLEPTDNAIENASNIKQIQNYGKTKRKQSKNDNGVFCYWC